MSNYGLLSGLGKGLMMVGQQSMENSMREAQHRRDMALRQMEKDYQRERDVIRDKQWQQEYDRNVERDRVAEERYTQREEKAERRHQEERSDALRDYNQRESIREENAELKRSLREYEHDKEIELNFFKAIESEKKALISALPKDRMEPITQEELRGIEKSAIENVINRGIQVPQRILDKLKTPPEKVSGTPQGVHGGSKKVIRTNAELNQTVEMIKSGKITLEQAKSELTDESFNKLTQHLKNKATNTDNRSTYMDFIKYGDMGVFGTPEE